MINYLFSSFVVYSYTVFIIIVSLIPIGVEGPVTFFDKIVHFAIYFLLSFIIVNARVLKKKEHPRLFSFFYAFCLGGSIECIQFFLPFRSFEAGDILCNILGSIAGTLFIICRMYGGEVSKSNLFPRRGNYGK